MLDASATRRRLQGTTARHSCSGLRKVTRASASGRPFRCDEGSSLSAKCGITFSSICPASFSLAPASASGPHASLSVSSSVSSSIRFTVSMARRMRVRGQANGACAHPSRFLRCHSKLSRQRPGGHHRRHHHRHHRHHRHRHRHCCHQHHHHRQASNWRGHGTLKQTPTQISRRAPRETCATCLGKATTDFADRDDQFRVCLRYSRPAVGSLHDRSGTHRQRFRTEGRSI